MININIIESLIHFASQWQKHLSLMCELFATIFRLQAGIVWPLCYDQMSVAGPSGAIHIHNVEEWSFDCYTAIINNHNTTLHNHVHIGFHVGIAGAFLRLFWGIEIQKCMELGRRCQSSLNIPVLNGAVSVCTSSESLHVQHEPQGTPISAWDVFQGWNVEW